MNLFRTKRAARVVFDLQLFHFKQISRTMADVSQQKTYHKKANGNALATVRKHTKEHDLKLFGSCFW